LLSLIDIDYYQLLSIAIDCHRLPYRLSYITRRYMSTFAASLSESAIAEPQALIRARFAEFIATANHTMKDALLRSAGVTWTLGQGIAFEAAFKGAKQRSMCVEMRDPGIGHPRFDPNFKHTPFVVKNDESGCGSVDSSGSGSGSGSGDDSGSVDGSGNVDDTGSADSSGNVDDTGSDRAVVALSGGVAVAVAAGVAWVAVAAVAAACIL
jgi:hypothetical protein